MEFYVQDFADRPWASYPGHWIRAQDAIFVIESDKHGAMGSSFVSFLDPGDADVFYAKYGGRRLRLAELTSEAFAASQQSHLERLIAAGGPVGSVVRTSRPLMGALFEIAAWVPKSREVATTALLDEALEAAASLEKQISSWDPDSETSAVNRAAGLAPLAVGRDLRALVETSFSWSKRTGGAFDVTVAPLLELWNRAGERGVPPTETEIQTELERVGFEKVLLEQETLFLTRPGMRLGFGAIGKGFAADRVAETLRGAGVANFIVDAGGDLIVSGSRGDAPWQVVFAIRGEPACWRWRRFPIEPSRLRAITSSSFRSGITAILTSWIRESGRPVSGLTSVTVFFARAVDSDALATALFVMGGEEGVDFVEGIADAEALFVDDAGSTILSFGLRLEGERLVISE